jgi:hypothetical protein
MQGLDAKASQSCFVAWVAALTKTPAEVVAIDGKTARFLAAVANCNRLSLAGWASLFPSHFPSHLRLVSTTMRIAAEPASNSKSSEGAAFWGFPNHRKNDSPSG